MTRRGPIEDGRWNTTIESFVVDPGPPIRVHGYDLCNDLVPHYGFAEVVLTALRGDAPTAAVGRAFDVALMLASPGSLAEAPAHAATLARMLSVPTTEVVAIAALALAEQASALVRGHADWIAWLDDPAGVPPATFAATTAGDQASATAVQATIDGGVCPVLSRFAATTDATIIALLHACGVRTPDAMVSALVSARLPCVIAESQHHRAGALGEYPIELPPFDYAEDDDE